MLFGTADLGDVGAGGHQHQHKFGSVESVLDVGGPSGSASDALGVEPGVEALFLQVYLQALGERGSVFAGVGEEDARLFRRWHWGDRPLSIQKQLPPTNCLRCRASDPGGVSSTTFGDYTPTARSEPPHKLAKQVPRSATLNSQGPVWSRFSPQWAAVTQVSSLAPLSPPLHFVGLSCVAPIGTRSVPHIATASN